MQHWPHIYIIFYCHNLFLNINFILNEIFKFKKFFQGSTYWEIQNEVYYQNIKEYLFLLWMIRPYLILDIFQHKYYSFLYKHYLPNKHTLSIPINIEKQELF